MAYSRFAQETATADDDDQNPFSNQDAEYESTLYDSRGSTRAGSVVGDWHDSTALHREWPISSPLSKNIDDSTLKNLQDDHKSRPRHTSGLGASPYTSVPLSSEEEITQLEQRTTFPTELPERPQSRANRNIFGRIKDRVFAHVDPRSILHLFDFRPWFYPFTWRKYAVLFLIACAIAGIIVSDHYTRWIEKSMKITRSYMLPVLIISVCAEPIIIMLILPIAIVPNIPAHEIAGNLGLEDPEHATEKSQGPSGPFETALVIPCHDTDHGAMRTTIDSALPHFRPEDIYIVDNGRTRYPKHPEGNFRSYIRSIHPDIVYMWSPIGSKNAAQLVGALAARDKGYKYIMTVDDDVCIPKNYSAPAEMINDKFKAVAYPIKAMDAQCNVPLWLVAWQDVEYRLSGLAKLCEDRLCGTQFPHGAGWFVELDAFIELMEFHHPMDFIAEDCNAGLGLSEMGKGIRFDARSYLATEVPTTFFGPGLNWWKQRQKSWEMGRHGRLFAFIKHFLISMPPKKTIQGILWHKLTFFYLICTIIIDWLRVPTIIALGRTATWWRNAILLMLFSAVPPLIYNFWKCRRRPDMKVRFWACITFPFYKQIYVVVAICGAIRWVGFYLGGHVRPPTIQQMLKNKDDRCFWLDPQFQKNPAWLADEAEAKEQSQQPEMQETEPKQAENESKSLSKKYTMPYENTLEAPQPIHQRSLLHGSTDDLTPPSRQYTRVRSQASSIHDPFLDPDEITPLPSMPPSPMFPSSASSPDLYGRFPRQPLSPTAHRPQLPTNESHFSNAMTLVESPGVHTPASYFDGREEGVALTVGGRDGRGERQEWTQVPMNEDDVGAESRESKGEKVSKRKSAWKGLSLPFRKGRKS
ncbi:hypothetical protein Vi05172_g12269 [Venturia inaequalis]|nr:hypothetical protein Vi05172_g12269 [Venturia inaequalis]